MPTALTSRCLRAVFRSQVVAALGGLLAGGGEFACGQAAALQEQRGGNAADAEQRVRELGAELLASEVYPGFVVGWITPEERRAIGFGVLGVLDPRAPDGGTLFEIGSVTKVFTGLLLADAVVRGELALDDPLASRLPEGWSVPAFVGPAAGEPSPGAPSGAGGSTGSGGPTGAAQAEPIRLWHLATHTSGLPRLPPGILSADPADPYAAFAAADLQAALAGLSLRRAPGSAYAYSNLGAGLLGFCLAGDAAALDRRFGERLFGPLGMGDTRIRLEEAQLRRLAQPHGEGGRAGSRWGFEALAGAGALHSSVDDLLRFAAIELGLASADPSSPGAAEGLPATLKATLESACRERWRSPKGDLAMGLGWHLEPESGVRWHNGQTGGYHSYLAIDPARSHGVVVLANAGAGQADALGARLRALLAGEAVPGLGLRAPVALEPAALEPLVGEYSAGFLQRRRVFREGPRLFLAETGAEPVRLYPLSPTRFFAGGDEREFEFEFEGDAGSGPASALVALRGERRERAKRIVPKPAETE